MFGLNKFLVFVAIAAFATQSAVGALTKAKVGHTVHLMREIAQGNSFEIGKCRHAPLEFRTQLNTTNTLCDVPKIGFHRDNKYNDSCHFWAPLSQEEYKATAVKKTKEFRDACKKAGGLYEPVGKLDSEGKPEKVLVNLVLASNPDKVLQGCKDAQANAIYYTFIVHTVNYEKLKDNRDGTFTASAHEDDVAKAITQFNADCKTASGQPTNQ
ncbi:hypothetical protein ACQY0O_001348 [Thecaphora frezii]